ncbi:MAG: hypothetical protein R3Y47_11145 [Lachnospiraceae bacterium]
MYFFDRKTMYLVWKKKELWKKSVGNVRFLVIEGLCRIEVVVTGCDKVCGKYLISVLAGEVNSIIGEIYLKDGKGTISMRCEADELGDRKIPYKIITGIRIDLMSEGVLEQKWLPENKVVIEGEKRDIVNEDVKVEEDLVQLFSDKWQQLCNIYPVVHPFDDGRAYLSIEPRDFVVLHAKYQGLVQNSFLLHSFYQNNHILLGRSKWGNRSSYYLGVAGIYSEKEKNMARIHGFEGFEGKEEIVRNGSFGYYMKRVEI